MAAALVEQFTGDFHPEEYEDDYQRELRILIEEKLEKGEVLDPEATFGKGPRRRRAATSSTSWRPSSAAWRPSVPRLRRASPSPRRRSPPARRRARDRGDSIDHSQEVGRMRVRIVTGDITRQDTDAIVNAANSTLLGGGGVDGAIHRAAGRELLAHCRKLRETTLRDGLPVGKAVATPAGRLPNDWVIHTVGPNWHQGQREPRLLASCFRESLDAAAVVGARSIAFPRSVRGSTAGTPRRWPGSPPRRSRRTTRLGGHRRGTVRALQRGPDGGVHRGVRRSRRALAHRHRPCRAPPGPRVAPDALQNSVARTMRWWRTSQKVDRTISCPSSSTIVT